MVFSGTFNNIMTLNSLPFMDRQYILARCILTVVYIIIALRLAPCCKEQLCISLGFQVCCVIWDRQEYKAGGTSCARVRNCTPNIWVTSNENEVLLTQYLVRNSYIAHPIWDSVYYHPTVRSPTLDPLRL